MSVFVRLGYVLIFLFVSLFVALLIGCQPVSSDGPSNAPFAITDKTAILDKTHVMGVKTTLYQPSFELQGVILPIKKTNIIAPADGMAILVADTSKHVFEDDVLFTITPAFFEEYTAPPVSVTAPFNGRLDTIYTTHDSVSQGDTLATFIDDSVYQFVSLLPKDYLTYLSVGQSVNFSPKGSQTTPDNATAKSFAGQVSHITKEENGNLSVTVQIPPSTTQLTIGQTVGGWVDYGQLDIGVVVPDYAIADGVNLAALTTPPYKPAAPLPAHIWIIKQDGTLALTDIHIVKYQPDTKQYLVTGMSQDALIVTANLPKKADGMAVKIR